MEQQSQQSYSTPNGRQQQTDQMPFQPPFTDQHNQVYDTLRNVMMQYHSQGVPGMQDLVNALNKTHQKLMSSYIPNQQVQNQQQATQQTQGPQSLDQLNSLMQSIRQKNSSQIPQTAQGYT